jgi:acetyl esterase
VSDTSRVDPELAAFFRDVGQEFANYPPVRTEVPYEPHRRTLDTIALKAISGGPVMTETSDRWVTARGRRILCRLYRPRVDERPPVMVHFHGGGWIQSSIDTHDRLAREYAAAGDVAVVSVDYSLSPEAKFPQALEESAAVVRHLAENESEWCVNGSRILLGGDSVGGNLALTVALLLRDTGGPPIKGILASYPVCDSRLDTPSYQSFGAGGYGLTLEQMKFVWDHYVPHGIPEPCWQCPGSGDATRPRRKAPHSAHTQHGWRPPPPRTRRSCRRAWEGGLAQQAACRLQRPSPPATAGRWYFLAASWIT